MMTVVDATGFEDVLNSFCSGFLDVIGEVLQDFFEGCASSLCVVGAP